MNQEKIGKYICEKRKSLNLTQKEVAEKIGVSDRTVSKWERGINLPDVSLYDDLCNALGISLVELLSGEDIEKDNEKKAIENEIKKSISVNKKSTIFIEIVSIILICFSLSIWITYFSFYNTMLDLVTTIITFIIMLIGYIGLVSTSKKSKIKKVLIVIGCMLISYLILNLISFLTIIFNANIYTSFDSEEGWYVNNITYYERNDKSEKEVAECYLNYMKNPGMEGNATKCFVKSTDPIGYEIYINNPLLLINNFVFVFNKDYKFKYMTSTILNDDYIKKEYEKLGYKYTDGVETFKEYSNIVRKLFVRTVYHTDEDYYNIYKYDGKLISVSSTGKVYEEEYTIDIENFIKRAIKDDSTYYYFNDNNDKVYVNNK